MYSFINEKWQKCYSIYNIIYIFYVIYGWITVKTAFIQKPPITRWNLEKYNVSGTKVLSLLLVLTLDIWVFSILLFINFVFACKRQRNKKIADVQNDLGTMAYSTPINNIISTVIIVIILKMTIIIILIILF